MKNTLTNLLVTIMCTNGYIHSQQVPHIKLRYAPESKIDIPQLKSRVLECEVRSNLSPVNLFWLKNGKRIISGRTEKFDNYDSIERNKSVINSGLSFTRTKLFLDCVTPADEGIYTCVGENGLSNITSQTEVRVARSAFYVNTDADTSTPINRCTNERYGK